MMRVLRRFQISHEKKIRTTDIKFELARYRTSEGRILDGEVPDIFSLLEKCSAGNLHNVEPGSTQGFDYRLCRVIAFLAKIRQAESPHPAFVVQRTMGKPLQRVVCICCSDRNPHFIKVSIVALRQVRSLFFLVVRPKILLENPICDQCPGLLQISPGGKELKPGPSHKLVTVAHILTSQILSLSKLLNQVATKTILWLP